MLGCLDMSFLLVGHLTLSDLEHGDFLVKYFAFVKMFISVLPCFSEWLFFDSNFSFL